MHAVIASRLWIVINTHANREQIALEHLTRQGFDAYCPLIRKRLSHARRKQDVLRPLFRGYLFVRIDEYSDRWRPILSTVGVREIVRFGSRLAFLDPDVVNTLRQREEDGAMSEPSPAFHVGEQVNINSGPFEGTVAQILSVGENERIVLLLQLLQGSVRAHVNRTQISRSAS